MKLELWQAAILGLVEGITEYLPVSSTGHLILAAGLMGLDDAERREAVNAFTIVVQGGAILAVLGLYWPSVMRMIKGLLGRDNAGFHLLCCLVIAFLPAGVLGPLLDDYLEKHFFSTGPVLTALALGGVFMMLLDQWRNGRFGLPRRATVEDLTQISPRQALVIGLLQCVAMIPGTSRSMMTIAGGVVAGLKPRQAAEFSFLLGLPTLGGATVYKLAKNLAASHREGTPNMFEQLGVLPCLVGIAVAAVSAAIAVKWLVGFLNRHGLTPFGWYRIGLCIVMALLVRTGVVQIGQQRAIAEQSGEAPALRWENTPVKGSQP